MNSLYIIGNGFDMFHDFKTSYGEFNRYVEKKKPDLANELEEYFLMKLDDNYLWKNFENDLATFNNEAFFDVINNLDTLDDSFRPSMVNSLVDEIREETNRLIDKIIKTFDEWISEISISSNKAKKIVFSKDDYFISFNYTNTLEVLYNIPESSLFYIHNKANDYTRLVFGHGEEFEQTPKEDELDNKGNSNRCLFTDSRNASRYPFYALKKDTGTVLETHKENFNKIKKSKCKEVIVLGHSLGPVDLPYFYKLCEILPCADWKISYHRDNEKIELASIAMDTLGISANKLKMIKIEDLERE